MSVYIQVHGTGSCRGARLHIHYRWAADEGIMDMDVGHGVCPRSFYTGFDR